MSTWDHLLEPKYAHVTVTTLTVVTVVDSHMLGFSLKFNFSNWCLYVCIIGM